jgi:DNA-binding NarL/FixJ family response regulator
MLQEEASAVLWQRVKDSPRVLFVEPDPFLGQSLLQEFNTAAVVVEWIRTAAELRARSHGRDGSPPRLVFLDWELPGAPHGEPLGLVVEMFPRAAVVVLSRELNGDRAAALLIRGIPSLHKPLHPLRLSQLVLELSADARCDPIEYFSSRRSAAASTTRLDRGSGEPKRGFGQVVDTYAASRGLSHQQRLILDHYLNGKSDKEIAQLCQCAEATVYEHWRRMAKKAGGGLKSHIIADFHRYLRQ